MAKPVCPYWVGYFLLNPLRRLIHDPDKILAPFVARGATVLDIGPAMGFFTLPLARMVGPQGKVIGVDMQEKMLRILARRAQEAQLADRIITRLCHPPSLGLNDLIGKIDFALAFAVVHEVPDIPNFFVEVSRALRKSACCLVVEPQGHVSVQDFTATLAAARLKGLNIVDRPRISWCHAALLRKD